VEGFGYWSGRDIRVTFRPAEANTGIVFVRGDLDPPRRIPALVRNRIEIPRRTTLSADGTTVEMVEHVMAALAGLSIDNCEVWVDAAEMPGCDGSSRPFVEVLTLAGVVEQDVLQRQLIVTDVTRVGDEESWVEASPAQDAGLRVRYVLDYGRNSPIGRQSLELDITPESFPLELAASRTFILKAEAQWLLAQGLCQRASCRDLLVFDEDGPVDNELRYEDECVRHKALDLVGDLALAGCEIVGSFVAFRSGHRLNAMLVRTLLSEGQIIEPRRRSA